jgi:Cd2+/Zn2+-exporting ATPase
MLRGQLFDEHFLMSLATIGALAIREFPEAVAVMLFYEVGELFESRAVGHARHAIRALLDIRPDYANLKSDQGLLRVAPERVGIGDQIVVKPGEKVPLDGRVTEGSTLLDTAAITGESLPRDIGVGDLVYSGSINKNGLFTMEVTRIYRDSTVARILDLVQNAANKKAPTEKFMTRFARVYTPAVVLVGAAAGRAAAPAAARSCFFRLALPGPGVPGGVLPLRPGHLDSARLFRRHRRRLEKRDPGQGQPLPGGADQSGYRRVRQNRHLTRGSFRVSQVQSRMKSISNEALLSLAAHAEHYSNHPIARSIGASFGTDQIKPDRIRDFSEIPGQGIAVTIDGQPVLAGSARYLADSGVPFSRPTIRAPSSISPSAGAMPDTWSSRMKSSRMPGEPFRVCVPSASAISPC